jgi:hypothetical protein
VFWRQHHQPSGTEKEEMAELFGAACAQVCAAYGGKLSLHLGMPRTPPPPAAWAPKPARLHGLQVDYRLCELADDCRRELWGEGQRYVEAVKGLPLHEEVCTGTRESG